MSQKKRLLVGVVILLVLSALVLGVEYGRGALLQSQPSGAVTIPPGGVPIYVNGKLVAAFAPADLQALKQYSFVDAEEGMTQTGWQLADILQIYLPEQALVSGAQIKVSSSSRAKAVDLTWQQAADPKNFVMFTLSGRGTLKLVSVLPNLSTRAQWVQDTDRIEVNEP